MASASNPNVSTRNALRRAQQILGERDAEVQVYYSHDPMI
jgi:SulP family sulfate permease